MGLQVFLQWVQMWFFLWVNKSLDFYTPIIVAISQIGFLCVGSIQWLVSPVWRALLTTSFLYKSFWKHRTSNQLHAFNLLYWEWHNEGTIHTCPRNKYWVNCPITFSLKAGWHLLRSWNSYSFHPFQCGYLQMKTGGLRFMRISISIMTSSWICFIKQVNKLNVYSCPTI